MHYKIAIIGGGLSGLTTAYKLTQAGVDDYVIIEGRDRLGGRINTQKEIDLGATWFQTHHTYVSQLLEELNIGRFQQYSEGKGIFIYSSMAPVQYFESDPSTAAFRIAGGSTTLIEALQSHLRGSILVSTKVDQIEEVEDRIKIKSSKGDITADHVIITIPPRLATCLKYHPKLPEDIWSTMSGTHTWMSNAIKVGINYEAPFWREKQLSGTMVGHVSPTIEIYDHSNIEDNSYSLMGFVNEGLRSETPENRKERILAHLEKNFGAEARRYLSYQEKDWSLDDFTSCEKLNSVYISPRYGNPIFKRSFYNSKLHFSGAETSPIHGGYMDGAIITGIETADKIRAITNE